MRLLLFNLLTDADDPILGFTSSWIRELARQVDAIDVLTMQTGNVVVPGNVRVYSVGKEKNYSEPRRALEFYRRLWKLLCSHKYEACFAHMMPLFASMGAPLLRIKRIPIVLWYAHKSVTPTLRLATFLVDRVVSASVESFRIDTPKVRIIGHGIDTERFVPPESRYEKKRLFTLLSVSRLAPVKQIDLVIEAVALLKQRHPDLAMSLLIAGTALTEADRSYAAVLEKQVRRQALEDRVQFIGGVSFQEIVPYYQQADCFLNMSRTGSIDKNVLEAMSCEVPVIANPIYTDILGGELASSWIVAWDAEQIAQRVRVLTEMPARERTQLGKQLRGIVIRDHNLRRLCERLLDQFRELRSAV